MKQTEFIAFLLLLLAGNIFAAEEKMPDSVYLEVKIDAGEVADRYTIFICNGTKEKFEFETGARGGPGCLDDRKDAKKIFGTAPTVKPVLQFFSDSGNCTITAPAFGGPTRRSMRPEILVVDPAVAVGGVRV